MDQFFSLTPEAVLSAVERALGSGARATGRYLVLHSMENRVFEIELEDGSRVVAKFYRRGRWSRAALLEEHRFLAELEEEEVPVVAPRMLTCASTIDETDDGILFAIFPKFRGRSLQELDDTALAQMGRLLARLHMVGARSVAPHRGAFTPLEHGTKSLEALVERDVIDLQSRTRYLAAAKGILSTIEPWFVGIDTCRLHGDCHLGNVLWQDTSPFFLDFDDMRMGPPVQDIWMIVRGRDAEAERQRAIIVEGYEQLRKFDRNTMRLVEPLRALRIIHYSAWIARRWDDPIFKQTFPEFATYAYWSEETAGLCELQQLIAQ